MKEIWIKLFWGFIDWNFSKHILVVTKSDLRIMIFILKLKKAIWKRSEKDSGGFRNQAVKKL